MTRLRSLLMSVVCCLFAACTTGGASGKAGRLAVPADTGSSSEPACSGVARGESPSDTFVIALTGDIMMGTTYPDTSLPPDNGRRLFTDVKSLLTAADIACGNLEGTLCDTTTTTDKTPSSHSYSFRTPLEYAPLLKEAGYDFLSMANNHAFDFGLEGVAATERALDALGIKYAGLAGRTECAVVRRRGVRFGLCAFGHNGYTLRHQDLAKVGQVLDSLRRCADIIIVSFHGGAEGKAYSRLPYGKEEFLDEDRGSLREFARFCIDNGADVVYGHGPHVVRCVELYRGRFVAYSLGNFCTPYAISVAGISGHAPVVEVKTDGSGRFVEGKIHSFIQRRGTGPRTDTTNAAAKQIASLTAADMPGGRLRIAPDGTITVKD